jgi:ATP-dependent Lhr-like helicase
VKLKKISDRVGGHPNYFSHHSSVDKDVREYVEFFAKTTRRENFTIACTSTLELGIDIGSVDEVVQIDATSSISSLIQRVGRSGRQDGAKSRLFLYATNDWSLLRALACWTLYIDKFIEPPEPIAKPYDILLHQALSITKGESGIAVKELVDKLRSNAAFSRIETSEIEAIIEHLIETDQLERIHGEVIIGLEGEKLVNSRDFYSVFETEVNFKVVSSGRPIGELQISPQVIPGENILLAARIWKIVDVDYENLKVEVTRALDGKKPMYSGGAVRIHQRIPERMLEIVFSNDKFDFLDEAGAAELERLRKEFRIFPMKDLSSERPFLHKEQKPVLFPFTGTRVINSIALLLRMNGIDFRIESGSNSFEVDIPAAEFLSVWRNLSPPLMKIRKFLAERIELGETFRGPAKFAKYLPLDFRIRLLEQSVYDFESTAVFVARTQLVQGAETRG